MYSWDYSEDHEMGHDIDDMWKVNIRASLSPSVYELYWYDESNDMDVVIGSVCLEGDDVTYKLATDGVEYAWLYFQDNYLYLVLPDLIETRLSVVGMQHAPGFRGQVTASTSSEEMKKLFKHLTQSYFKLDHGNKYDKYAVSIGHVPHGWIAKENYGSSTLLLRKAICNEQVSAKLVDYEVSSTGRTVNCTIHVKLV